MKGLELANQPQNKFNNSLGKCDDSAFQKLNNISEINDDEESKNLTSEIISGIKSERTNDYSEREKMKMELELDQIANEVSHKFPSKNKKIKKEEEKNSILENLKTKNIQKISLENKNGPAPSTHIYSFDSILLKNNITAPIKEKLTVLNKLRTDFKIPVNNNADIGMKPNKENDSIKTKFWNKNVKKSTDDEHNLHQINSNNPTPQETQNNKYYHQTEDNHVSPNSLIYPKLKDYTINSNSKIKAKSNNNSRIEESNTKHLRFQEDLNKIENLLKTPKKSSPTKSQVIYSETRFKFTKTKINNIVDQKATDQIKSSQVNEVFEYTISPKQRTKNLSVVITKIEGKNIEEKEKFPRNLSQPNNLKRRTNADADTILMYNKITKANAEMIEKSCEKPKYKTGAALNKFLINDFMIGGKIDPIASSRKKAEMTDKLFRFKERQRRDKLKKAREAFEIQKFGAVIAETDQEKDFDDSEEQVNALNEIELIESNLKKLDDLDKKKIKERSEKLGEMIQNISIKHYVDNKPKNMTQSLLINKHNLERVIRVRDIVKRKFDPENDNLGIQNLSKFKEQRLNNDDEIKMCLKSLGPPSFLKINFKSSTLKKFQNVNGKNFGY